MTRTYDTPGVYGARLLVLDDSGAINGLDQDEVAIRINHQPVANAGTDRFTSDTTVGFDAGASADADGDALVYRWDFGDGSPPAGGVRVTHTYADGGTYPVVLTVDDGTKLRNATAVAAVTVDDRPATGGRRRRQSRRLCRRHRRPRRQPLARSGGRRAALPLGLRRRHHGRHRQSDQDLPARRGLPGDADGRGRFRLSGQRPHRPRRWSGSTSCRSPTPVRTSSPAPAPRSSSTAPPRAIPMAWSTASPGTSATAPRGGGERPVHVFAKPGDYRVVLTIEGDEIGQCANTNSAEMTANVVDAPIASIAAPGSVGVGAPVAVRRVRLEARPGAGSSAGIGTSATARTAQGPVVEHSYAKPGSYVAALTLRTEGGVAACSAVVARHSIIANAPPVADAGSDRIVAIDEELLFDASGSQRRGRRDRPVTRGISATAQLRTGSTRATAIDRSGRYQVTLTVTDDMGLPNSTVSDTAVGHRQSAAAAGDRRTCGSLPRRGAGLRRRAARRTPTASSTVSLGASATGKSHRWCRRDPRATQEPGLYELTLRCDDGTGLSNARKQADLPFRVNRQPRAEAGPDRLVCPGEEVDVRRQGIGRLGRPARRLSLGLRRRQPRPKVRGARIRFAAPGLYEVRLAVTDNSGSSCATDTNVARVRVNATPVPGDRRRPERLRRRRPRRAAARRLRLAASRRARR